jgi:hypothetical protein
MLYVSFMKKRYISWDPMSTRHVAQSMCDLAEFAFTRSEPYFSRQISGVFTRASP